MLTWVLLTTSAIAVREVVVIDEPQLAQRVKGVVLDAMGTPITDMKVTDCGKDWKTQLRSTTTDRRGQFHFSGQRGKRIYYLRFDHPLWNPLELKLKIDKHAPHRGITAKPEIGG
jgi:hypothetical protein